jgi:hypothetical protein
LRLNIAQVFNAWPLNRMVCRYENNVIYARIYKIAMKFYSINETSTFCFLTMELQSWSLACNDRVFDMVEGNRRDSIIMVFYFFPLETNLLIFIDMRE